MKKSLTSSTVILFLGFFLILFACKSREKTAEGPQRVIFETDMGNDIDDALALDMLYKYANQGKIDLLGVSSNKDGHYSTEFIDILNTWFGYPDIPIGHVVKGPDCETDAINYARKVCEMRTPDSNFLFKRSKPSYESNLESTEFYRSILSQQPDTSVCIISVGFSTNLARLLGTQPDKYSPLSGKDLVAKKVKSLVLMAGDFRSNKIKEYNIFKDGPAARKVFAEWPTPIVTSPFDIGIAILYPATVIEKDSLWGNPHPVVEAYKAYQPMPYDRPTWDLTAVLYAIEPDAGYFNSSEHGIIKVDENNFTTFTPDKNGKHAYLSVTSEQAQRIKERLIYLTTQNFHKN
jgi:inosine-uridine nucleoside N-ribohydrolase